jgi:nucleoside 2-deoxyribosyltransferase
LHSRHIKVTKESFIEQCHFDPKSIEVGINSLLSRKFIDFQDNNLRLTYDGMNFVECNIFSLHFSNKIFLIAACHDDIYWLIDNVYRPIAEELNFSLVFQEKTEPKDTIHEEIWENIKGCKLIICDLTHSRPNCFIEFGYALALNRPMICCIEDVDGHDENRRVKVPFDVNNKNWHFWHREWISRENESEIKQKIADFKMELKKAIQQKLIILEAQSEI